MAVTFIVNSKDLFDRAKNPALELITERDIEEPEDTKAVYQKDTG